MIQSIVGPGFSGKSFYLQCYSGYPIERVNKALGRDKSFFRDNRKELYLGPSPEDFLTGFYTTVKNELFNYRAGSDFDETDIMEYLESIEFTKLFSRDPFTLSGGEKVILSVLSFACSNPRSLSIDNTLEQLGADWKVPLLECLLKTSIPEILMTDNRLNELPTGLFKELRFERIEELYDTFMKFERVSSEKLKPLTKGNSHRLEVSNLSFAYGQNFIFKMFDLALESGKVYHLKGKNGAGKSTLSKILAGLIKPKPDSGFVFDGKKTVPYSSPGKLVGYTYQQCDDQLFSKTVASELGLTNQNNDLQRLYIQSLAEAFGLQEILTCHPFELPISMRKRLSIAATLAVDRPFYILDEPTLYLDDQNVRELQKIIIKLSESGKGIVLISHSKSFINQFSDFETIDLLNHQI